MSRARKLEIYTDSLSSCGEKSSGSSTIDVIKEICNDDCSNQRDVTYITSKTRHCRDSYCQTTREDNCYPGKSTRYDPGVCYFTSVITPLTGLSGFLGIRGCVEFRMRRKNKTVTLQWEPFSGSLASSGISYLTVAQNISNTPPYIVSFPIYLTYKGTGRNTRIEIDPFSHSGNIRFYLNTDGSTSGTNTGDNIEVAGGSITWVVD